MFHATVGPVGMRPSPYDRRDGKRHASVTSAGGAEPQPGLTRSVARGRLDAAVRTMLEGYGAIVEAARVAPRGEMAVGDYALRVHAAAMARAADELLKLAGEVGSSRVVTDFGARLAELEAVRACHLEDVCSTAAALQQIGAEEANRPGKAEENLGDSGHRNKA
eukprot:gnl/TRDRNA2_/TRDRNA2_171169_c0_seq1.p1 gnl/TRDRNA2_/TRDRNA2_171169_c0~~gnl/TRDRNA2_/TRDRNA2_171169_c0_seq1.p1  ORF type:complete len:164 (-),score=32.06 gnl/TRDRNA2_/TRDRNA2_171169_c0_seq1:641-1132(-)